MRMTATGLQDVVEEPSIFRARIPSARESKTYGLAHSTIPGFDEVLRDAELNQLYTFYVSMKTVPALFGGIIPTDIQGFRSSRRSSRFRSRGWQPLFFPGSGGDR
jgi:hypothetical protein